MDGAPIVVPSGGISRSAGRLRHPEVVVVGQGPVVEDGAQPVGYGEIIAIAPRSRTGVISCRTRAAMASAIDRLRKTSR